eukprot:760044-Hanusia_phi.AAC.2
MIRRDTVVELELIALHAKGNAAIRLTRRDASWMSISQACRVTRVLLYVGPVGFKLRKAQYSSSINFRARTTTKT